ncbi:MAG: sigma-70 family RNA polymerase sigma factor [Thiomonas sp.]
MEIATQQPAETCVTRAWRVHQAEIEGYLRHRLGDGELAADLLQTVFLKALHEGRRFCELREPRAWLFAVARNALADHLRVRHVAEPLPEELAAPSDEAEPVDTLADCLPVALAALDPDDRDVLSRCDLQGMTQKDYAQANGLSLPAVKSRVLRARARLRLLLVERCGVRFDAATGRVCCSVPRQPASACCSASSGTTAA